MISDFVFAAWCGVAAGIAHDGGWRVVHQPPRPTRAEITLGLGVAAERARQLADLVVFFARGRLLGDHLPEVRLAC